MRLAHRWSAKGSFFVRVKGLQFLRALKNILQRPPRLASGRRENFPVLLAESVSLLHTTSDPAERQLMLGKIENLRLACQKIDKRLLRAGEIFSLWRQLGPPWSTRGYAVGREVREGCIVPTVGGGLCQISGALMELAGRLQFTIIERHRHTALPPDVRYVETRDATLFWNYVDLRFAAPFDVLFEAYLTETSLVVRLRAGSQQASQRVVTESQRDEERAALVRPLTANATNVSGHPKTAYLLGEPQPEFVRYLRSHQQQDDLILAPFRNYPGLPRTHTPLLHGLRRSATLRWMVVRKQTVAKAHFALAEQLANYYARQLDYRVEHLCVAQTLLPYLWRRGKLGGRSFDVLMYRAPITLIESELEEAIGLYPQSTTLREFRAPAWFAEAEAEALAAARHVITPHAQIASLFDTALELAWERGDQETPGDARAKDIILFPGPTLARKGVYAVREAIRETGLSLMISGSQPEGSDFWKGLPVIHSDAEHIPWHRIHTVVQPALFEYWPRQLLRAQAAGARLLISPGCGIREERETQIVHTPFGDVASLAELLINR